MKSFLKIPLLLLIIAGCSHPTEESAGGDSDPCANAVGNGLEIVAGPSAPGGGDTDQVFRSLEVDPSNPDVVYVGTERNS